MRPIELAGTDFRRFLYDHDDETLAPWRGMGYQEFADARRDDRFLQALLDEWNARLAEPFAGVTSDGVVHSGLYRLVERDDDADLVAAAERVLATLSDPQLYAFLHPLDAEEWRAWSNPEFVFHRVGLRLEELDEDQVAAILALIEASLSPEGYERVREAMQLNGFLGELVDLPTIMNDRSYWVALYGDPVAGGAWGWQLFGHHVAVHFVTVAGRHVVAPVFIGAEPALSDGERPPSSRRARRPPWTRGVAHRGAARAAVVYDSVLDPKMPADRLHPADERHVAGAFQDNRLIPNEGISAYDLDDEQWSLLLDIIEDFLLLLRDDQRGSRSPTSGSTATRHGSPGTAAPTARSRSTSASRAR